MMITTMTDYYLRDVDPSLWRRLRDRATAEGKTIRAVLLMLIRRFVQGEK